MSLNLSGVSLPLWSALLAGALALGGAACSRWDPSGRAPAATTQQVVQAAPPTTIVVQSPAPLPAAPPAAAQAAPAPVACGKNSCKGGEVCCSEACGVCAAPGSVCPQNIACPPAPQRAAAAAELPRDGIACGTQVCRRGEVCCNPSCGICAGPDDSCSQRVCDGRDAFEKKQEADLKVGQ